MVLKNGADLIANSELLGHSQTDTTTCIYQQADFEMHQDAVKRLVRFEVDTIMTEQQSIINGIKFKPKNVRNL